MTSAYACFDDDRQRIVAETSAFVTWGLKNPDKVRWIPTRPQTDGGFSRRLSLVFWTPVFVDYARKPATWLRRLLGR